MGRVGFEPTKAEPADLQSAPFDRSGIDPHLIVYTSRLGDSNPGPTVYKTVALPAELRRHNNLILEFHQFAGEIIVTSDSRD